MRWLSVSSTLSQFWRRTKSGAGAADVVDGIHAAALADKEDGNAAGGCAQTGGGGGGAGGSLTWTPAPRMRFRRSLHMAPVQDGSAIRKQAGHLAVASTPTPPAAYCSEQDLGPDPGLNYFYTVGRVPPPTLRIVRRRAPSPHAQFWRAQKWPRKGQAGPSRTQRVPNCKWRGV